MKTYEGSSDIYTALKSPVNNQRFLVDRVFRLKLFSVAEKKAEVSYSVQPQYLAKKFK
jgi:hypothetical protein